MSKNIDDEIMMVLAKRQPIMTYVIANSLRMEYKHHNGTLKTDRVLRRLKVLEKQGLVERTKSIYLVQLCWQKSPDRH